jgi:hypothetical protein
VRTHQDNIACKHAGTPLKPALHALHAYSSEAVSARIHLSEAVRTMLLHRRQVAKTKGAERRAGECPSLVHKAEIPLQQTAQHGLGRREGSGRDGNSDEVRGAAGSAVAAVRSVRAPKAVAKVNWLTAMGSDVSRQRNKRHVAPGRDALLPAGVVASQSSGKLTFPVTYKFHEVLSCSVSFLFARAGFLSSLVCCAAIVFFNKIFCSNFVLFSQRLCSAS